MKFGRIYLIRSIYILLISTVIFSCSQTKREGNMKWISKYSFFDLYKANIKNGQFPPGTGLNLKIFKFLDDQTIFLGGSKSLHDFYNKPGNSAVLFISKDKGKVYQEVTFPEENVTNITPREKYTLVETNIHGYSPMGKNFIYLFDNFSLQYNKIDEYPSNDKINYKQFNGDFVIYSYMNDKYLLNIFTKEKYQLPSDVNEKNYILNDLGTDITFLKDGNKIVVFNAINKTYKILKELKNSYSTIMNSFGEIYLGRVNLLKTSGTIYDLNEKELFESSPKTEKRLYRYKNFACRLSQNMPYTILDYSYNYGKTWYKYEDKSFITSSTPKGFYKDQYILMDTGFYGTDNNADIVIGEFQK